MACLRVSWVSTKDHERSAGASTLHAIRGARSPVCPSSPREHGQAEDGSSDDVLFREKRGAGASSFARAEAGCEAAAKGATRPTAELRTSGNAALDDSARGGEADSAEQPRRNGRESRGLRSDPVAARAAPVPALLHCLRLRPARDDAVRETPGRRSFGSVLATRAASRRRSGTPAPAAHAPAEPAGGGRAPPAASSRRKTKPRRAGRRANRPRTTSRSAPRPSRR